MTQCAHLVPTSGLFLGVEVDLDPTFSDLYSNAYLSALVYIPSTIAADMNISSAYAILTTDGFNLNIEKIGGIVYWEGTGGPALQTVTFNTWTQVEIHAVAGASTYDVRIGGTLHSAVAGYGLPATGVNWVAVQGFAPFDVGDGGGTSADDTILADELCYAFDDWVSQGGTVQERWAFEDANPIVDANANYPTPAWSSFGTGVTFGSACGGSLPDLMLGGGGGGPPDPVVCGEGLSVRVYLDGTEITDFAVEGAWSPRLNRPAQAHAKIPMDRDEGGTTPLGDCGSLLKIVLTDGVTEEIVFHGPVLNVEVDTEKDGGYTVYNAQDHMELWQWRIVRADDGDFSKPVGGSGAGDSDLVATYVNAPEIMAAILANTVDTTAGGGAAPPTLSEGPIFLDIGTVTPGTASMAGAPVDWPQTIQEFFATLVSTGQLDAYIEYTDPGGGVTGTVHLLPGNLGVDRSATVGLYYGVAPRNAAAVRWNRDMTNTVNKYQIFAGPRVETAGDAAGDQHWCFNITGDDGGLARPPGGDVNPPYSGGIAPGSAGNELGGRRLDSQAAYGVRMRVDIFDAYDGDCVKGVGTPGRNLLRYQWQVFSWLSAMPREIIHMDAVPDTLINCFHVGDLIHVEASSEVRGGFSGKQRVYGYTVEWEGTPSVLTLTNIQTSDDAEVPS